MASEGNYLNLLYDFEIRELMLIHSALSALRQLVENDSDSAPRGMYEAILSTIEKIETIAEQRIHNDNSFAEIVVASLQDVENYSKEVITQETENK